MGPACDGSGRRRPWKLTDRSVADRQQAEAGGGGWSPLLCRGEGPKTVHTTQRGPGLRAGMRRPEQPSRTCRLLAAHFSCPKLSGGCLVGDRPAPLPGWSCSLLQAGSTLRFPISPCPLQCGGSGALVDPEPGCPVDGACSYLHLEQQTQNLNASDSLAGCKGWASHSGLPASHSGLPASLPYGGSGPGLDPEPGCL